MNMNIRFITRTAILLALTIVFQSMGRFLTPFLGSYNSFVVGPLVNASLLVSTALVGIGAGAVIAIASPFGAILTGAAIPLPFAPFIAIGNFIIVFFFYILMNRSQIIGLVTGAFLKFAFLWGSVLLMIPVLTAGQPEKKATAMKASLLFSFSWPQLVTALVGGILAILVIKAIRRTVKN